MAQPYRHEGAAACKLDVRGGLKIEKRLINLTLRMVR